MINMYINTVPLAVVLEIRKSKKVEKSRYNVERLR
jgi:hypothetical protein